MKKMIYKIYKWMIYFNSQGWNVHDLEIQSVIV